MAKGGQDPEGLTGGSANCMTQKKLSVSGCPVTPQKPRNWGSFQAHEMLCFDL